MLRPSCCDMGGTDFETVGRNGAFESEFECSSTDRCGNDWVVLEMFSRDVGQYFGGDINQPVPAIGLERIGQWIVPTVSIAE